MPSAAAEGAITVWALNRTGQHTAQRTFVLRAVDGRIVTTALPLVLLSEPTACQLETVHMGEPDALIWRLVEGVLPAGLVSSHCHGTCVAVAMALSRLRLSATCRC